MALLIRIPYGEKGKASGYYDINLANVSYIAYHKSNEGVIAQGANSQAYAEVFFSDGRASIILNDEQYAILIRLM
jgi:hypothetical protein